MGFAALLFPPMYDSYRHYMDFFNLQEGVYYNLTNEAKFDFLLLSLDKIIDRLGLYFEIVKLITVWISYEIIFWIYRDIIKRNPYLKENHFIVFLLLFLAFPFIDLTLGMRQLQGTCLFVLGIYLLFYKNKWGYVFTILACCMHFSFLIYILPFIIFINRGVRVSKKKVFFMLGLIIIFLNPIVINKIIAMLPLPTPLYVIIDGYLNGKYSEARLENRNLNYLFFFWFTQIPLFIYMYCSLRLSNKKFTSLSRLSLIILVLDYCISFILFGRFIIIFVFTTICAILQNGFPHLKKLLTILVFFSFLATTMSLIPYRKVITSSYEYRLALPVPIILLSNYSPQWIFDHFDADGYPKP